MLRTFLHFFISKEYVCVESGRLESWRNVAVTCWQMLSLRDESISTFNHLISSPLSLSLAVAAFVWRFQVITDKERFHTVNQIVLTICSPATCIVWHGVFLWDIHLRSNPLKLSTPLDWWEVAGSCGWVTGKILLAMLAKRMGVRGANGQNVQRNFPLFNKIISQHHNLAVSFHFPSKLDESSESEACFTIIYVKIKNHCFAQRQTQLHGHDGICWHRKMLKIT